MSKFNYNHSITTPDDIKHLDQNQIFVFGSNYAGRHGRGAALVALKKFGARNGQGTGIMGKSYGIATKDHDLKILPLSYIETQVNRFIRYAERHPELTFFVTKIGCGLAGYKPKEIAPLFIGVPSNVILPDIFVQILQQKEINTK